MNGISRNSPIAAVGIAAIVAIAQGDSTMCSYFAFVCVAVITIIAVVRQSLLDHNDHTGDQTNGKVETKNS